MASVTSPIDSLKNGFEAVYGGYGRRHTRKSWEIQNTKVSERIQRWYDDVVSDHGRDVKFSATPAEAVNQS